MQEKVTITRARYLISAVGREQYPEQALKEFVFIGRSNVGKSSLINSLSRVHNLARVSAQPGKTQTINFYELGANIEGQAERKNFYLVDLPGYGYAKAGRGQRELWAKFIREYLLNSERIQFVCQLVDIRHELMASDLAMFRWLVENNLPVLLVATKADKLGRSGQDKSLAAMRRALGVKGLDILPYSSLKNTGRAELLETIAGALLAEEQSGCRQ